MTRLIQYSTCPNGDNLYMSLSISYIVRHSQDSAGMEFKKENQESLRPPRSMVSSNKSKPIAVSPSLAILPIHHLFVIQGNAPARSKYSSGSMEEKIMKILAIPSPLPGHRNTTDHYNSSTQV